jgi:ubiquinone/menaquinone biosynthesis C-methylase UbiE
MKELEDHSWFPPVLRNFQTDFIGFVVASFNVYDAFIQHLKNLSLPVQSMTDLCSGSGEAAINIFRKSNCFSHLYLSDKFPNDLKLDDGKISYDKTSTDVLEMEFNHGTYYTMFNAFHHFTDEEKLKIVTKIQNSGSGAFIVEILEPTVFCFLKIFFTTTLGSLLLTPFIRPFSLKRLFFTYILPINILTISFDGIVSVFKSRSVKQYQKLFTDNGHAIKVFRLQNRLSNIIIIQIEPVK